MENIILIGGGGHCKSVIDVIEFQNRYTIVGIVDVKEKLGMSVGPYKVIGSDDDIPKLINTCKNFHITVGHIKSNTARVHLFDTIKKAGGHLPVIVSPNAYVSKHTTIEEGTIIMHQCIVNTGVKIGKNVIVNNGALLEHDTIVKDHCHISTGAIVNADCLIERSTFVGSNCTVNRGLKIGASCVIGSGSVVTKEIPDHSKAWGIPAKIK